MDIKKTLDFLITTYGLNYEYQKFSDRFTHSFFNKSGCFTVQYIPSICEMSFLVSPKFSNKLEELCEKDVDVWTISPEIWNRRGRFWIFKRPLFWCFNNNVITTFAEALKIHLEKERSFFGIQV